jgi:putative membrane protein
VKSWLRWTADALALFLALYLLDSAAKGRFQVRAVWVAVILALLLGLLNSFVRPLRRIRTKPFVALATIVITVLANALILQIFIWAGAPLTASSFMWIFVAAAFVALLTGVINWLVGFNRKEKVRPPRPAARQTTETARRRKPPARAPRNRS